MRSISTNIYYISSINYLLCHFDQGAKPRVEKSSAA